MHPLGVLIVYDWLWLCKYLVKSFELGFCLVALDYVRFLHPLDALIVNDWL